MAEISDVISTVNDIWKSKLSPTNRNWLKALEDLGPKQLEACITKLQRYENEYPPTPGMVRKMGISEVNDGEKKRTYSDHPEFNRAHMFVRRLLDSYCDPGKFAPPIDDARREFPIDVQRVYRMGQRIFDDYTQNKGATVHEGCHRAQSACYRKVVELFSEIA